MIKNIRKADPTVNIKMISNIPSEMGNSNYLLNNKNKIIKGLVGHPVNTETLLHYQSKSVVYSFKKANNLHPLLTKTEYLLKSLFLSMYSLISKPVYLIKHDKIIIRLFVFLSPKVDRYLDTSPIVKGGKLLGVSPTVFSTSTIRSKSMLSLRVREINKFLKFKQVRPQITEILKTQMIRKKPNLFLLELEKIVNKIINNYTSPRTTSSTPMLLSDLQYNEGVNKGASDALRDYPYISFSSTFKLKLEKLREIFIKIFKKEVEFEIIKAQLPFQDSNILAQILGYNANNYRFIRMLKILIPRAVIKNPSKELSYIPNNRPHKKPFGFVDSTSREAYAKSISAYLNIKVKDLNMLFSQPSSYLPPFFFSKYNLSLPWSSKKEIQESLAQPIDREAHGFINNVELLKTNTPYKQDKQRTTKLSYLSGMNINLAGRLMTQSMRPRFTVQSKQEGSLARVKVHFTEKSRFTGKNKRGAFSFTVSISHVLNTV
jgi:hypothetical protein